MVFVWQITISRENHAIKLNKLLQWRKQKTELETNLLNEIAHKLVKIIPSQNGLNDPLQVDQIQKLEWELGVCVTISWSRCNFKEERLKKDC